MQCAILEQYLDATLVAMKTCTVQAVVLGDEDVLVRWGDWEAVNYVTTSDVCVILEKKFDRFVVALSDSKMKGDFSSSVKRECIST